MTLLTLLTLSIFLTVASRFASIKMSVIVLKQARFLTLSKKVPKVSKVSMQIFCILPIHVYQAPGANTSGASFTNSYLTAFLATGARLFRTIISHKIVTNLVKVPHIFAYVGFFLYLCTHN